MTVTADETAVDIAVDVRFNLAGKPLAVRYQGDVWPVAGTPTQWFGGSDSPEKVEYWRAQVCLGSSSAVRIFTLRREHLSRQWFLESIAESC
ncbi:hypothetical protein M1E17_21660 [Arthrobacter sp. D1-29]